MTKHRWYKIIVRGYVNKSFIFVNNVFYFEEIGANLIEIPFVYPVTGECSWTYCKEGETFL